jgi:hypothetical protein
MYQRCDSIISPRRNKIPRHARSTALRPPSAHRREYKEQSWWLYDTWGPASLNQKGMKIVGASTAPTVNPRTE